ncbi:MAG TPA: homoserine dehydrogenase, partial [Firmicutes bacterium]|nr:homoserine dehydrogenase [Bacillota bacterium]
MPDRAIGVGMLGMGTVGGGVAAILKASGSKLKENTGFDLQLKKVLVRDTALSRKVSLPPDMFTT